MTFEQLQHQYEQLKQENAILRQQLEWFKRKVFGHSAEKFDHPELFGPEEAESGAPKKEEASPGSSAPEGDAAGAAPVKRR